jgi:hypothetical protein
MTQKWKGPRGGRRPGAGRKPAVSPSVSIILHIQATEEQIALIRGLTPRQRRDKLLAVPSAQAASIAPTTSMSTSMFSNKGKFHKIRVELAEARDRDAILALGAVERAERLLAGLT